jgi:hypothetical protein
MTNGNVGTLIRFRGLVWPYAVFLASVGGCVLLEKILRRAAERHSVEAILARSVLARRVNAFSETWSSAARTSIARRGAETARAIWRRLAPPQRVQLVGCLVLTFAAVHVLLLQLVPLRVAPAIPRGLWALVFMLGMLLIMASEPLAAAWRQRRGGASGPPASP